MAKHNPAVSASAPGKVLLTGGFLVLDRAHTGLVFGLNARIHVHVTSLPTSEGVSLQEIIVQSPQFKDATWRFGYHTAPRNGGILATQLRAASSNAERNPFVETALTYALTYLSTRLDPAIFSPAKITILADDDYYSNPGTALHIAPAFTSQRFSDFNVPLFQAHKTGLGSSAALVTAFIAAVLLHYLPATDFSLNADSGKRTLHNLAQAAHSAAQGKVGSGFDVASAVFGSCVYRRFSPHLIENVGESGSEGFAHRLRAAVEEMSPSNVWDTEITKSLVTVPKGLRLVMCDVDCGSKTPGMVKQVLEWRKLNPREAGELWSSIQYANDRLAAELIRLETAKDSKYDELARLIQVIRALVRSMSTKSGVPIEPRAQTQLLDACTALEGVVGGVAPGAGGYDAVALIVQDSDEVMARVSELLSNWKFEVDDPGVESTGRVRLLGVREEMEGVRAEDPSIR